MSLTFILLMLLGFAAGTAFSIWHARRRFRAQLADRIAREVEREIARRVLADIGKSDPQTQKRKP